jgi:ADP-ribose pyrophosphatase YjhB (NUDIX family)
MANPQWLAWAQTLQALSQNGLAYSDNPFDRERFHQIRGIAARMTADLGKMEPGLVEKLFAHEAGYATPKLDIRGVVFKDEKVLLVKELADGRWTLPGGWVDINESPSESVEREVLEESGYQVKAVKLLALYDYHKHEHPPYFFHLYKLFFLCNLMGGEPRTSLETGGCGFYKEDDLPPLSTGRVTKRQLHQFFMQLTNPDLPTEFD